MAKDGGGEMAIVAVFVTFAAGYITTPTGQKALKDATEAVYVSPVDIFVFSILAALSFEVMSKRFQSLHEYPSVCMIFACSAIAYIFLRCRGSFAWTVYLLPALVFYVFVIPKRVHKFLFKEVDATHRFVIESTSPEMAFSCAMAIRKRLRAICERLGAISDEGLPL